MNELKAGYRVLVDATITNVDIENGKYYVRVSDHGIWMKEDKVHSINTDAKTYEDGLREAWETAQRLNTVDHFMEMSTDDFDKLFGNRTLNEVFNDFSPQDAAAKIAEWEKKEIRVNDEVCFEGNIGVVYDIRGGKMCEILGRNAELYVRSKEDLTKTGRTIDIAGLLAQIGGAEQ